MNTKPLKGPLPDEHILQVDPRLQPSVEAGWRSRPNLYMGRALSAEGLSAEQLSRSGHLALRGQMVAPGVVSGLQLRLFSEVDPIEQRLVHRFLIGAGLGLAPSGEDVILPRSVRVRVDQIPAYWQQYEEGPVDFDLDALANADVATTQKGLQVAVLVLVPVVSKKDDPKNPNDGMEPEADDYSFEDWRQVDGCTPVLYAWPKHWPMPKQDAQWRNRLAWMLFDYERQRPQGEFAPWEQVGVPLALIGFQPPAQATETATPLFVDRAAVVRSGGAPRSRSHLLDSYGNPLLWQARSLQFSEHLTSFSPQQLADGSAIQSFAFLPPIGSLPKSSIDLFDWTRRFFPPSFVLEALPVPLEQLDSLASSCSSLAPLSTELDERVRVLVPVPSAHFDPFLLQTELLDPSFPLAISSSLLRLSEWLRRRKDLRSKANLLLNALEGNKTGRYPDTDPAAVPGEYVSSGPVDSSTYGPEESSYGTQDNVIPELEETFDQWGTNGSWVEPARLGFDAEHVSAASAPESHKFGVITRYADQLSHLPYDHSWQGMEFLPTSHMPAHVDSRAVWSGNELIIVALARDLAPAPPPPAEGVTGIAATDTTLEYAVTICIGRKTPDTAEGWTWEHSPPVIGLSTPRFSVVSWGPGRIDAFVALDSKIQKFTWMSDQTTPFAEPKSLFSDVYEVSDLVALHEGQGQITLLFLGRDPQATTAEFSLRHLTAFHVEDSPDLAPGTQPDDQNSPLEASEVTDLSGTLLNGTLLSACRTSASRVDVLVMRPNADDTKRGIYHGWLSEGDWRFGTERISQSECDALQLVSRFNGRAHAFWWQKIPTETGQVPGPLTYRWFDGNRWQSPQILTRIALHQLKQPFSVLFDGTALVDLFLASLDGLQHQRMLADTTRALVETQGLRGLVTHLEALLVQLENFIRSGSAQIQADTQHVRHLMISGSTEASRLAVSPILGATMVQSPLAARADIESFLTRFRPRTDLNAIRLPDAMETLQQATSTRATLTQRFIEFVKELGIDVAGMTVQGVAKVTSISPKVAALVPGTKIVQRENIPVLDLVSNQSLLDFVIARINEEPDAIERALAPLSSTLKWTETDYFSTSVQHLENVLVLLRELDRRSINYERSVAAYKDMLTLIEGYWAELDKRLKVVDGEVAEGRQDVVVARALMTEELLRLDGINQRRKLVFDQHVPFLVFQRPRERDLSIDAPSRVLDPGLVKDILPEVFASTEAAPPELLAYVELVRDSPLEWFSFAPSLLRKLDRVEFIQRTFVRAQVRAIRRVPIKLPLVSGRSSSRFFLGMSRIVDAREELTASRRNVLVHFEPAILETQSWLELQQSAHAQLSLDDLIDMSHGRAEVGREAATELEHISKVATGLYERFGEVLPVIRLEWAEQLSQYDGPVNLRDLSRLPSWDRIDVTDRREMQTLVDWLFQRVASSLPEAVSLMNDLVRLCMLLASHAPVNELLSGHVSKPAVAKVGGTLELAVDPSRVRIGMHVQINSGGQLVQAVVEDLSTSVVRARVLSTTAPTVSLKATDSARFSDPALGRGVLLPYVGRAR